MIYIYISYYIYIHYMWHDHYDNPLGCWSLLRSSVVQLAGSFKVSNLSSLVLPALCKCVFCIRNMMKWYEIWYVEVKVIRNHQKIFVEWPGSSGFDMSMPLIECPTVTFFSSFHSACRLSLKPCYKKMAILHSMWILWYTELQQTYLSTRTSWNSFGWWE